MCCGVEGHLEFWKTQVMCSWKSLWGRKSEGLQRWRALRDGAAVIDSGWNKSIDEENWWEFVLILPSKIFQPILKFQSIFTVEVPVLLVQRLISGLHGKWNVRQIHSFVSWVYYFFETYCFFSPPLNSASLLTTCNLLAELPCVNKYLSKQPIISAKPTESLLLQNHSSIKRETYSVITGIVLNKIKVFKAKSTASLCSYETVSFIGAQKVLLNSRVSHRLGLWLVYTEQCVRLTLCCWHTVRQMKWRATGFNVKMKEVKPSIQKTIKNIN